MCCRVHTAEAYNAALREKLAKVSQLAEQDRVAELEQILREGEKAIKVNKSHQLLVVEVQLLESC